MQRASLAPGSLSYPRTESVPLPGLACNRVMATASCIGVSHPKWLVGFRIHFGARETDITQRAVVEFPQMPALLAALHPTMDGLHRSMADRSPRTSFARSVGAMAACAVLLMTKRQGL